MWCACSKRPEHRRTAEMDTCLHFSLFLIAEGECPILPWPTPKKIYTFLLLREKMSLNRQYPTSWLIPVTLFTPEVCIDSRCAHVSTGCGQKYTPDTTHSSPARRVFTSEPEILLHLHVYLLHSRVKVQAITGDQEKTRPHPDCKRALPLSLPFNLNYLTQKVFCQSSSEKIHLQVFWPFCRLRLKFSASLQANLQNLLNCEVFTQILCSWGWTKLVAYFPKLVTSEWPALLQKTGSGRDNDVRVWRQKPK